jgi:hypothetical protein
MEPVYLCDLPAAIDAESFGEVRGAELTFRAEARPFQTPTFPSVSDMGGFDTTIG